MNDKESLSCSLMHKSVLVVDIELDLATGMIRHIGSVYAPEHLPIGIKCQVNTVDRTSLNDWWMDRSIPASRSGIRIALEKLQIANTKLLLLKCYGLSLSDQYWICPKDQPVKWEQVNFFQNEFSEDFGDVLFGKQKNTNQLDMSSPDNTSDGDLKKRWKIINGERYLLKGGSNPFRQQPFNEVIATGIMQRLGIPCVPYTLTWDHNVPYSACKDFIDEDSDLVPAWRIYGTKKKYSDESIYQHFVKCCDELGIKNVVSFLDRMIVLDYLIANEDRHMNNFGAVRNANTLDWIGMAPIYDSGSSLGYDKVPSLIRSMANIGCKPFKANHVEQLKLVTDFSWLHLEKLQDVGEFIYSVFSNDLAKDFIDEKRIESIVDAVQIRIRHLRTFM